jgi:signal recognition particle subunit SRP54
VVKDFIARVRARAVGDEVTKSLTPAQQVVKIVHEELITTLGAKNVPLAFASRPPTVVLMAGLQGSGKTTTAAKLGKWLASKGKRPVLVACDLQRPAAVRQLQVLGEQTRIPVFAPHAGSGQGDPVRVALDARAEAERTGRDVVIVDTAGRTTVDVEMMAQAAAIRDALDPTEVLLVVDAMTGQDAVQTAVAFQEGVDVTGVVLTKLDGDARGGAALSIKEVTKVPIKFIGVGEKLDRLEEFHPERMAQRIMGQGDLMGLVEKVARVQAEVSQEELQKQQEKLAKGALTLVDFRNQFAQLAKMGGMKDLVSRMPGMSDMIPEGEDPEVALRRVQGMIDSMTAEERRNPDLIDQSRRRRIAAGSGTEPHEIKQFLQQFDQVRTLMRQMAKMSIWERMKMVTGLGKMGAFMPGARLKTKGDTGHRKSAKERAEDRKKKRKQEKKGKRK